MVDGAPVPDTAMDTKSEDEVAGGPADATPLTDDEQALLDRLREGEGAPAGESPYGAAVDPGTPAPGSPAPGGRPGDPPGGDRPDPLDPVFREPGP